MEKQRIRPSRLLVMVLGLLLPVLGLGTTLDTPFSKRADVQNYINELHLEYGFNKVRLEKWFGEMKPNQKVLDTMDRPYESMPWYVYEKSLVSQARIRRGVKFWNQNAKTLQQAEATYGVPASVIVAILGVETSYGRNTGHFSVFNSLATLAFAYPRRAKFFQKELTELLLLSRQDSLDPRTIQGSYAGAIGMVQFMPSSYRRYAIDFTGNGQANIQESAADAIGSIANYLQKHGWQKDQPVAERARIQGKQYRSLAVNQRKIRYSETILQQHGVSTRDPYPQNAKASLVRLEAKNNSQFWLGFNNFYVITRYNPSNHYAMAVYQLGNAIEKARDTQLAQANNNNLAGNLESG